jgi:hypothetical protein
LLLLLLLLSRRVTKLADDDDSRSFSLLLCDIFVECREHSTSVLLLTTTRKGKREIGKER